jgi:hypothetical protein
MPQGSYVPELLGWVERGQVFMMGKALRQARSSKPSDPMPRLAIQLFNPDHSGVDVMLYRVVAHANYPVWLQFWGAPPVPPGGRPTMTTPFATLAGTNMLRFGGGQVSQIQPKAETSWAAGAPATGVPGTREYQVRPEAPLQLDYPPIFFPPGGQLTACFTVPDSSGPTVLPSEAVQSVVLLWVERPQTYMS